jgi:hypothetical protein
MPTNISLIMFSDDFRNSSIFENLRDRQWAQNSSSKSPLRLSFHEAQWELAPHSTSSPQLNIDDVGIVAGTEHLREWYRFTTIVCDITSANNDLYIIIYMGEYHASQPS